MHHVHESPPVMLVPLLVLAVGALFAGVVFHGYFIGEDYARVLEGRRCSRCRTTTSCTTIHDVPLWVEAGAVRRHAARLR